MTCLKRVSICWYIFTLFSSQSTASVVISTMNDTSNVDALRPHRCIKCSGHQPQSAEAVKRVRLDAIKRTILQKLRLSLPHGVARVDLPRLTEPLRRLHAVAGEDSDNQDYFYGHRTHIAIIAHEGWHMYIHHNNNNAIGLTMLTTIISVGGWGAWESAPRPIYIYWGVEIGLAPQYCCKWGAVGSLW